MECYIKLPLDKHLHGLINLSFLALFIINFGVAKWQSEVGQ